MTGSSREVVSALMLPQSATLNFKSNTEVFQGGGEGEWGSSVLMHLVCLVHLREMEACSSRLLVAERRTRVAKGTPVAAAAADRRCRGGGGSQRRLARSPRRLARARRGVFWMVTSATSPWAICDASMGHVCRVSSTLRHLASAIPRHNLGKQKAQNLQHATHPRRRHRPACQDHSLLGHSPITRPRARLSCPRARPPS